jgi:DTW domain-containing protein YfiP
MMTERKLVQPCHGCDMKWNCVCEYLPTITADWDLVLLTHPNELRRATNTGKWLSKSIAQCQVLEWSRTGIPNELNDILSSACYQPVLLFPGHDSQLLTSEGVQSNARRLVFIVLDGTWQEAKKMYNRSPWLKALPHYHIQMSGHSRYSLRRNQAPDHFCTLEVGTHLLSLSDKLTLPHQNNSGQLTHFFEYYLQCYQADKSGHRWKG